MGKLEENRKKMDAIDKEMTELFIKRMKVIENIAKYKKENNLPVINKEREAVVITTNADLVEEEYRQYYIDFISKAIKISRDFQAKIVALNDDVTKTLILRGSTIYIREGIIDEAANYMNLQRKVLIVSDTGVPHKYINTIKKQCLEPYVYVVKKGEASKCLKNYEKINQFMIENYFTRTDCVVAVGGGVVGDLAGYVASTYMRGINYYNIPTTLLSQVDSSIGGKTAIDMGGTKNVIGSFYEPKVVLIDKACLATLDTRLFAEGLVEAFKMGITNDKTLVDIIMNSQNINTDLDMIIYRALKVKQSIVERDEKEASLRRILNYGHTFGHAIEEMEGGKLYHGECVGLGMLYLSSPKIVELVKQFLAKYCLPMDINYDPKTLMTYVKRDKKADGAMVNLVYVDDIEKVVMKKVEIKELEKNLIKGTICQMF